MARYEPDRLVRDMGRRVAELRRERGLTQQALASKLPATMQWVQQIEYGANLTVHFGLCQPEGPGGFHWSGSSSSMREAGWVCTRMRTSSR